MSDYTQEEFKEAQKRAATEIAQGMDARDIKDMVGGVLANDADATSVAERLNDNGFSKIKAKYVAFTLIGSMKRRVKDLDF